MGGRVPLKVFTYTSTGEYLQTFDSIQEFRQKYYSNDTGLRPIFRHKELGFEYHFNEKEKIVAVLERIGRDKIKRIVAIHNSEYCKKEDKTNKKPPVQVFNLRGELIAEFKNQRLLTKLMPHISQSTLTHQLTKSKNKFSKTYTPVGLFFKYKTN